MLAQQPVLPPLILFHYQERISTLTHNANVYALSIILASQFIFFNLHYIIGATLTIIGLLSLIIQIIISIVEFTYLNQRSIVKLNRSLAGHFWVNHAITGLYIPFLIWTVVLMYQRASV